MGLAEHQVESTPLEALPGTYVLMLKAHSVHRIEVGRWGKLEVVPGYYLYIGSAFGPGGVRARVLRHARDDKPRHWHIDYLREVAPLLRAYCSYAPERLEHRWAQSLAIMPEMSPVEGFGCSDCDCYSHLMRCDSPPEEISIREVLGARNHVWLA